MNIEALEKLIRGVILPQFPFIKDFEVDREVSEHLIGIRIIYHVTEEYKKNRDIHNLQELSNQMFRLIGFPSHVIFLPIYVYG